MQDGDLSLSHTRIHTQTHTDTHTHTHTHRHTQTQTHTDTDTHTNTHRHTARTHTHTQTHTQTQTHTNTHTHAHTWRYPKVTFPFRPLTRCSACLSFPRIHPEIWMICTSIFLFRLSCLCHPANWSHTHTHLDPCQNNFTMEQVVPQKS